MSSTAMAAKGDVALTILYSGNLDGELEPCGCSAEGNLGGIKRRTALLDKYKKNDPSVVIISAGGLISSEGPNDRLKSEYILKAFTHLKYDAIGLQWKDLAYGVDFSVKETLPWVASNWLNDDFQKNRKITRVINGNKVQMQFFSWLDPSQSPTLQMQGKHGDVDGDIKTLAERIAAAKKQGALTILATSLPLDVIKALIPLDTIDLLFERAAYEVYGEPKKVGGALVVQPGSRGMRLGKLSIKVDANNGSINSWEHQVLPMPESVADAPRMSAWYDEYNEKVKQNYLKQVAIRKQHESGDSLFVGEEACKTCHTKVYQVWQESDHAIAYDSLEVVGKSFDPNCLQCHTVGLDQAGGFIDMSITPHLLGVQCESCHGAGKLHVASGGKTPVPNKNWSHQKICGQCHTQPHSPSFKFDQYWPKIKH
ncbi:MAG: hypothetical protein GXP08_12395 [Gammaproteobacteria bacterium]|nr:hypothetical protein [Gammaproteobacteria bacterium]